jgi:hypothetical protein
MDDQKAPVEVEQDPLAAAANGHKLAVSQSTGPFGAPTAAERLIPRLNTDNPPAQKVRAEVTDDGFDFRQLRHGGSSPIPQDYTAQSVNGAKATFSANSSAAIN